MRAAMGKAVDVGREDVGMTVDAQAVAAELIGHDHDNVGLFVWHDVMVVLGVQVVKSFVVH